MSLKSGDGFSEPGNLNSDNGQNDHCFEKECDTDIMIISFAMKILYNTKTIIALTRVKMINIMIVRAMSDESALPKELVPETFYKIQVFLK